MDNEILFLTKIKMASYMVFVLSVCVCVCVCEREREREREREFVCMRTDEYELHSLIHSTIYADAKSELC